MDKISRQEEILQMIQSDPKQVVYLLMEWEREMSDVIAEDYDDWWDIPRVLWPTLAKLTVSGLKTRLEASKRFIASLKKD